MVLQEAGIKVQPPSAGPPSRTTASRSRGMATPAPTPGTLRRTPTWFAGEAYGFLPWNAQATNDYCEVEAMAYLLNVYYHPTVKAYFEHLGGNVSPDLYALSALLQWVWRSRIRTVSADQALHPFREDERLVHPLAGRRQHPRLSQGDRGW